MYRDIQDRSYTRVWVGVGFLVIAGIILGSCARFRSTDGGAQKTETPPPTENLEAEPIKIAFIGDTEAGADFGKVLKLIEGEAPTAVMINGDFGYFATPNSWRSRLTQNLNTDVIPVFGSLGNHDVGSTTNAYMTIFDELRTEKSGLRTKCTGVKEIKEGQDVIAVDEVCTFGNVSIVASAIGQVLSESYLEERLDSKMKAIPASNWRVAGYHFTLESMNPGLKGDENTYRFFDLIRSHGAIGIQAHTHSVMASCPISSSFVKNAPVLCHPLFGADLLKRFVESGVGMYFDSSTGGKEVRSRGRCDNPKDQGCTHMVDLITNEGYTRVDGTNRNDFNGLGSLFITFNEGRDPYRAVAYYKSIDGKEIFRFTITRPKP